MNPGFSSDFVYLSIQWLVLLMFYVRFSRIEGSQLNILTPSFLLTTFQYYYFDLWSIYRGNSWIDSGGFYYVTLINTGEFIAFAVGLSFARKRYLIQAFPAKNTKGYGIEALLLLLLAGAVFFPIIQKFGTMVITDPRLVYTQTRTGWGLSYFMAAFFIYAAIGFALFTVRPTRTNMATLAILSAALLLSFGSKGKIIGAWTLIYFWYLYHKKPRLRIVSLLAVLALALPVAASVIDAFTVREGIKLGLAEKMDFAARYADYNKNQAMVAVDENPPRQGGMLFEDFILSKVPRVIYPSKPKNFGEFALAEHYYSDWFLEDNGAPRFGNAMYFIDFGVAAPFVIMFFALLSGLVAGSLWNGFLASGNPYSFMLFGLANGVVFLSAGAGSFALETILFLYLAYMLRYRRLPVPSIRPLVKARA